MTLAKTAHQTATAVAMQRKRTADQQQKKDFELRKKIYIQRIEKKIMKLAEDGQYKYEFGAVPYVREHLSADCTMFVAIAKHFHKQGFEVKYDGKTEGDKRDWNDPARTYFTTWLTISWEN